MYFDEAVRWLDLIDVRKTSNYQMLLAIAHNPHVEKPEELWDLLKNHAQIESMSTPVEENEGVDKAAFAMMRNAMSGSNKMIVK